MGFWSSLFGGGGKESNEIVRQEALPPIRLPDYAESEGARQNWWDTLQKWQTQPGYGAIQPNWNDIWSNARSKVQRYFTGGPEGPGAIAQVKSRLAARGESENPAAEASLSRLGMQQGNLLTDLATQMATEEARMGEEGRQNWLGSLQQLAGLKPAYMSGGQIITSGSPELDVGSILGQGVGGLLENKASTGSSGFDSLDKVLDMFGLGSSGGITSEFMGGDTGIGDVGSSGDGLFGILQGDSFGDMLGDPTTYKQIAMIASMFCWVAATVFDGWDDPRTHYARHFIKNIGPKWFMDLYIKYGEKFADFIKDKPVLKNLVRPLFSVFAFVGKKDLEGKAGLIYG